MLTIRLARTGRKNLQQYRIVVQEHTWSPSSGKCVEELGSYNPTDPTNKLIFEQAKAEKYIKNGARPSSTLARLFKKNGMSAALVDKFIKSYTKKKSKSAPVEEPKKAAPAAAAPAAEPTPAPAAETTPAA